MSSLSMGDMASSFQMRIQAGQTRANLSRLSAEVTTGLKADIGKEVSGDFTAFSGIERGLRVTDAYRTANIETATLFAAAQTALDNVQEKGRNISTALLTAQSAEDLTLMQATGENARQQFNSVVSNLNTRLSGRSLFAGAGTDGPALASGEDMMAELVTVTTGLTTAVDVSAAVDAWFDDVGGGFETTGYLGSLNDLGPMNIADDETAEMGIRSDDPEIRDFLKAFAKAALVGHNTMSGNVTETAELMGIAASELITNDGDLTGIRTQIGTTEERIETAQARIEAERSGFEMARNNLLSADPYETATRLQEVYAQMEALYTITARIASLKFTDYI
jgi:flagellar hook-associated protein 3 FlgL